MRYLCIPGVILCFALAGCVNPQLLRDTAQKNRENIANYAANSERLYPLLGNLIELRLHGELNNRRNDVQDDILRHAEENAVIEAAAEIEEIRARVNVLTESEDACSQAELGSLRLKLNVHKSQQPAAYDVAIGRMTAQAVLYDRAAIRSHEDNFEDPVLEQLNAPLLDKYTLVKEYKEASQSILNAYHAYTGKLKEQGRIAERHAEAFVFFCKGEYNVGNAILETLRDVEVQKGILDIVRAAAPNDEKLQGLAQTILTDILGSGES